MDLEPRKHGQIFRGLIKAYKRIMSFSLSARKLVACLCSMVAIPVVVLSQNTFLPTGGEYSIGGKLPGDQVHPQLSITTNGGYIVWQDYWVDGKSLGVGAMRLKNDLSGSGLAFRVNSLIAGDQENAQVSMLNNGGAAFAWEGGPQSLQHIYSRFLSGNNIWLTGDVLVSSGTNYSQTSPAMATLLNGNVAMVYGSSGQAAPGSMMDIYLQILDPSGNRVGGEVLVNQFTANNQRSPAVAALADGKFIVGWVSEQQRWTDANNGVPSVDVYTRIFDSTGSPLTSETLVNVSSNICAYPDLIGAADGGYMVTWMEKDTAIRNNGWDIYARRFTSASVGGDVTRVNTQLYGDQHSPKIRRAGSTYLDIWTSLGQDGSREGVYGSYLHEDGTTSGGEFPVNSTTFGAQTHQVLGSDGAGRFLAAWTSFGVGVTGFDLYGEKYINPTLVVLGTNSSVFNTDPNANPNSVISIPAAPLSPPDDPGITNSGPGSVTNSFADVKGTYNGLVYDSADVTSANSGYITIAASVKKTTGSFSAKLQLGSKKISFSGAFDVSGAYSGTVSGLTVHLLIDLHGGERITGDISNGTWKATLLADLATKPTTWQGSYTMVIQSEDVTMGSGIGTVVVDKSGNVSWSLILPDGTKLGTKTTLSKSGLWPLYAMPYKTGGVMIGWMQFGTVPTNGFSGDCIWTKPVGASAIYPKGLTNGVTVYGSYYKVPPGAYRTFQNSKVVFSGGGLTTPITNSVTWGLDNKIVPAQSPNTLKLSLTSGSGLFKGTVAMQPGKGQAVSFQGVLFEKNNVGLGFFVGPDQSSGTVIFAPNP
jgi:hypothetical protein